MHDLIFANQRELTTAKFEEYAKQLGLDLAKFKSDSTSAAVKQRVDNDSREAAGYGVTGTPGFFINGKFLSGDKPFAEFKTIIDQELSKSG